MARVTDRLLVQQADDLMVFLDESTGAEVTFPITEINRVIAVLEYFAGGAQ